MSADPTSSLVATIVVRAVNEAAAVLTSIATQLDAAAASVDRLDLAMTQASVHADALGGKMQVIGSTDVGSLAAKEGELASASRRAGIASEEAGKQVEETGFKAALASKGVQELGKSLLIIGGIAAGVIAATTLMASTFANDMALIQTQAQASGVEVTKMSAAILDMATSVGTSPDQLANSLYHIESAGIRGAKALQVLKAAAIGAAIGHANLETVTQSLITLTNSHIKGIQSESQAMAILNGIVGAGDMRMQDLADAMSTGIISVAHSFGLSITDVGAGLATLGDNLMQGSMAATRFKMSLSMMASPTTASAKALATIGIGSLQLAQDMRKPQGLLVALQDLRKHLVESGMSAVQQAQVISKAFGGGRSAAAIMVLLEQTDRVKAKYKDITAAAKEFGANWAQTQQQASYQMGKFKAAIDVLAIRMGTAFLPALRAITDKLIPFVSGLDKFSQAHPKVVAAILGIAISLGVLGVAIKASTLAWKLIEGVQGLYGLITKRTRVDLAVTDASLAETDGALAVSRGSWLSLAVVQAKAMASSVVLAARDAEAWVKSSLVKLSALAAEDGGFVALGIAGARAAAASIIAAAKDSAAWAKSAAITVASLLWSGAVKVASAAKDLALAFATGVYTAAQALANVQTDSGTVAMLAYAVSEGAAAVAAGALAVVTGVLGLALDSLGIGLIISAVVVLVAAIAFLITHLGAVKDMIGRVASALSGLVGFISSKVIGIFRIFQEALGAVGGFLDGLTGRFGAQKTDLLLFIPIVGQTIFILQHLGQIFQALGSILAWFGSNVLQPLMTLYLKFLNMIPGLTGAAKAVGNFFGMIGGALSHAGSSIDKFAHSAKKSGDQWNAAADLMSAHARAMRDHMHNASQYATNDMKDVANALKYATEEQNKLTAAAVKYAQEMNSNYTAAVERATMDILKHGHATEEDIKAIEKARAELAAYNAAYAKASAIGVGAMNKIKDAGNSLQASYIHNLDVMQQATQSHYSAMADDALAQFKRIETAGNSLGAGPKLRAITAAATPSISSAFDSQAKYIAKEIAAAQLQIHSSSSSIISQTGASSASTGMDSGMANLVTQIGKLPSDLRGAMKPVLDAFHAQMTSLRNSYVTAVRTEDQAHISNLKNINATYHANIKSAYANAAANRKSLDEAYHNRISSANQAHEQAISNHMQNFTAAQSSNNQTYKAHMGSFTAAQGALYKSHINKLQSLYNAHVQKMGTLSGKSIAAANEAYSRQKTAANTAYQKQLAAINRHISGLNSAFGRHEGKEAAAESRWLSQHDAAFQKGGGKLNQSYIDSVNKIKDTLNKNIGHINDQQNKALSKENQAHAKHLALLKKAFETHAAAITKAMKAASAPSALFEKLKTEVDGLATKSLAALDFAVLTHTGNLKKATASVIEAQKKQKQLSDAEDKANLLVAKASGDFSTVMKNIVTKLSTGVGTALDKVTYDIYEHGKASAKDVEALVRAEKQQKKYADAQAAALLIVAKRTGDWSAVLQSASTKLSTAVSNATDKITLDILKHGVASTADVNALVKAEQQQKKFTDAQAQATLIVAKANGEWSTVLQTISTKLSTDLGNATDKITLDFLNHGKASEEDIAALKKAKEAQDAYSAAQQAGALVIAQATGDFSSYISQLSGKLSNNLAQALDKSTTDILQHGAVTQGDIASVQAAQKAQEVLTNAQWDAAYATADLATQTQMLNSRFSSLVSAATTAQSAHSGVDAARLQVLVQESALAVSALGNITKDIQNQTAIISAQTAVMQAQGAGQLAAVKDQAAIISARAGIAQATTSAQLAVAEDQLRVAVDTARIDQVNAAWTALIAQDQLRLAIMQRQVDQANATAQMKIGIDNLAIAKDNVALTEAQLKLSQDQLVVQNDIDSTLKSVNNYAALIHGDLLSVAAAQSQVSSDQQTLTTDTSSANQLAASGAQTIAQEQQQIALDQQQQAAASLQGQMQIAEDQNRLAIDQANAQLAATNTTNSLLAQQNGIQTEQISYLEQLLTDSRSAVAAHQSGQAASTSSGYFNNLAGDRAATVSQ